MNIEEINTLLETKDKAKLIGIINILLRKHSSPVFGAVKQIEHEIAAIESLKLLGYLTYGADEYDYIDKLKVTKAKARSLMYQEALRQDINYDDELKKVLQNPSIQKDAKGIYLIEVSNPLIMDKLRKKVRDLGFISDETFSGSLAKISIEALAALIDSLVEKDDKNTVIEKLKQKGYPDASFKTFIKKSLIKVGSKLADDTGEEITKNVGAFCSDILIDLKLKSKMYIENLGEV